MTISSWLELQPRFRQLTADGHDLNRSLRQTMAAGLALPVTPKPEGTDHANIQALLPNESDVEQKKTSSVTPLQRQTPPPAQQAPLTARATRTLWVRMAEIYGYRWTSAYGEDPAAALPRPGQGPCRLTGEQLAAAWARASPRLTRGHRPCRNSACAASCAELRRCPQRHRPPGRLHAPGVAVPGRPSLPDLERRQERSPVARGLRPGARIRDAGGSCRKSRWRPWPGRCGHAGTGQP
jgi:hypothetical protein